MDKITTTIEDASSQEEAQPSRRSSSPRPAPPPLSNTLRYIMLGVLAIGVLGAVMVAFVRQSSVKPPPPVSGTDCKDPVTENRLLQAVRQNPNDFNAQMDWGGYNLNCKKDYTPAISAFEIATRIADKSPDKIVEDDRLDSHIGLGLSYLYSQRFKPAETEFRTVLSVRPDEPAATFYLASTLYLSDPQQALTYFEKVVKMAVDNPGLAEYSKISQQLIDDIKKGTNKPTVNPTTKP